MGRVESESRRRNRDGRMKPGAGTVLRAGLAVLCVWAVFGSRGGTPWLEALVPAQREVYAALMPDFEVRSFGLQTQAAHLTLRAVTRSRHYLVAGGRVHEPGIDFEVETPARSALLYAVLIVIGALFTAPAVGRAWAIGTLLSVSGALFAAIVTLPLILAGEQWGLAVGAGAEPSLRAMYVAGSGFLLHGGGYALCAAAVWAVAAFVRTRRGFSATAGP
jgi:hypothetical protein